MDSTYPNIEELKWVLSSKWTNMPYRKPSEELLELLEDSLSEVPFVRRKIFGQYALFLNGNMLAGGL